MEPTTAALYEQMLHAARDGDLYVIDHKLNRTARHVMAKGPALEALRAYAADHPDQRMAFVPLHNGHEPRSYVRGLDQVLGAKFDFIRGALEVAFVNRMQEREI